MERNRGRGAASRETLEVEGHLRTIQARAMELERKRGDIIKNINHLKGNIFIIKCELNSFSGLTVVFFINLYYENLCNVI